MTIKITDLMTTMPEDLNRVEDSYLWENIVNYFKVNNTEIASASDILLAIKSAFQHEVLFPLELNVENAITYPPSNPEHNGIVFPSFWLDTVPAFLIKRYYLALVS